MKFTSEAAAAGAAKAPIAIMGASGRFNLFFKRSLSSATSRSVKFVILETICSNLGEAGLLGPSAWGAAKFSCVAELDILFLDALQEKVHNEISIFR